jgi:hypothetical protein
MNIGITGATGLIGTSLISQLLLSGHQVRALTRTPKKITQLPEKNSYHWKEKRIPPSFLAHCDAVIHLAGEGIADRYWTQERKQKLWDSRISSTKSLVTALGSLSPAERPKVLVSASAIGIYPLSTQADEESELGDGFLSELCVQWEKSAREAENLGMRTIQLRTGLVLSKKGGILAKTGPVILGNGKQWMSWIHINDVVNFILYALENESCQGPYNLTAPHPVTNEVFTKTVARTYQIPITIKAPSRLLKILLGQMSSLVLANQKIFPKRTLASGFAFQFTKFEDAIADLIGGSSFLDHYFSAKQFIPRERSEIYPFFTEAQNLETLTPPWLHFQVKKQSTTLLQEGTLIDYQLKIHGIPAKWRTLISHWNPDQGFVDEQLKGPYRKWHHVHTFETIPGGTLISDDVTFRLPGWIFGRLLLPFIQRDIEKIFQYRQEKIQELYAQNAKP